MLSTVTFDDNAGFHFTKRWFLFFRNAQNGPFDLIAALMKSKDLPT